MKTVEQLASEAMGDHQVPCADIAAFAKLVREQALDEAAIKCFSMREEANDMHWHVAMLAASGAIRDLKSSVPPDQETPKGV